VKVRSADKPGDATINGKPGVLMLVHKQPYFNTLDVPRTFRRLSTSWRLRCRKVLCYIELFSSNPPSSSVHRKPEALRFS